MPSFMRLRCRQIGHVAFGVVLCWAAAAAPGTAPYSVCAAAEISVGVANIEITPPPGYRMSGYFSERFNTDTLDPLYAKAVVFRQGETRAAMVFCDLIGMSREVTDRARAGLEQTTGIPAANISICATHSHTGPLYFGVLRELFHARALQSSRTDPHEREDYSAALVSKLLTVVEAADRACQPVTVRSAVAQETRLAFNRRFHMKDGTVKFNPGLRNPEIVRVAGPIDPEVGLVRFDNAETGQPVGALTVFAMHLDTVGGTRYSGDYPALLSGHLRTRYGDLFVSLFGTGTCGDINHVDVTQETVRKTPEIASLLSETVIQGLQESRPIAEPSLQVASGKVNVPLQTFTPEQLDKARKDLEETGGTRLSFIEQVEAFRIVSLSSYPGTTIDLEVHAIQLGPELAIVTLPGEVFVELGQEIKRRSPFEQTLVIELANTVPAYIPTEKAFAEGSYEIVNSHVKTGGGEAMVNLAVELLQKLDSP